MSLKTHFWINSNRFLVIHGLWLLVCNFFKVIQLKITSTMSQNLYNLYFIQVHIIQPENNFSPNHTWWGPRLPNSVTCCHMRLTPGNPHLHEVTTDFSEPSHAATASSLLVVIDFWWYVKLLYHQRWLVQVPIYSRF